MAAISVPEPLTPPARAMVYLLCLMGRHPELAAHASWQVHADGVVSVHVPAESSTSALDAVRPWAVAVGSTVECSAPLEFGGRWHYRVVWSAGPTRVCVSSIGGTEPAVGAVSQPDSCDPAEDAPVVPAWTWITDDRYELVIGDEKWTLCDETLNPFIPGGSRPGWYLYGPVPYTRGVWMGAPAADTGSRVIREHYAAEAPSVPGPRLPLDDVESGGIE